MTLQRFVAIAICLTIVGVAIWRNMEVLAIISFSASLSLIYTNYSRRIYALLLEIVRNTKQAKFGGLEVALNDGAVVSVNDIEHLPAWGRILLSQLNSQSIGVLIQLSQGEEKDTIVYPLIGIYANLRARGLLEHDAVLLRDSKQIWLSETGLALSALLLKKTDD